MHICRAIQILLLACMIEGVSAADAPPGLIVDQGRLMRADKPYVGMGINYFRLYDLADDEPTGAWRENLKRLKAKGIPFVRFRVNGFWPKQWEKDVEAQGKVLDRIAKAAEEADIGLIPSLLWNWYVPGDLNGESINRIADGQSRSAVFVRDHVAATVRQLAKSPAVWGWEVGNEYNLAADLPNAKEHRPPVQPNLGTPETRGPADELTVELMIALHRLVATTVRSEDSRRALFTGNSSPRGSAWHNTAEKSWKQDDREQTAIVLKRDNPDPIDTLTVHLYASEHEKMFAWSDDTHAIVAEMMTIAQQAKKPLFIGEFGYDDKGKGDLKEGMERLIGVIEQVQVPLSAVWNFDLPQQDKDWNITFDNKRALILDLIGAFNRKVGALDGTAPQP
jgi:hypothetical protein